MQLAAQLLAAAAADSGAGASTSGIAPGGPPEAALALAPAALQPTGDLNSTGVWGRMSTDVDTVMDLWVEWTEGWPREQPRGRPVRMMEEDNKRSKTSHRCTLTAVHGGRVAVVPSLTTATQS